MSLTTAQTLAFENAGREIARWWLSEERDASRVSLDYDLSAPGDVDYLRDEAKKLGLELRGDEERAIFRAASKGYRARVAEERGE